MDTTAYLISHGWAGHGHSLNPHSDRRGITKPITIPQKKDHLGVGKKRYDAHADQWWARAYDDVLKGVNTSSAGALRMGHEGQASNAAGPGFGKRLEKAWFYGNFVRGEGLGGTLGPEVKGTPDAQLQREALSTERRPSKEIAVDGVPLKEKQQMDQHGALGEGANSSKLDGSAGEAPIRPSHQNDASGTRAERRQRKRERRKRNAVAKTEEQEEHTGTTTICHILSPVVTPDRVRKQR
ncbi:MAG: hypothetical protein Q9163_000865 [Psora crenata]